METIIKNSNLISQHQLIFLNYKHDEVENISQFLKEKKYYTISEFGDLKTFETLFQRFIFSDEPVNLVLGYKLNPISPLASHPDYRMIALDRKIQHVVEKADEWAKAGQSGELFPRKILFHILKYAAYETTEVLRLPLCKIKDLFPDLGISQNIWNQFPGYLDGLLLHTPEFRNCITYNPDCSNSNCISKKGGSCIGEIVINNRHKIKSSLPLVDFALFEAYVGEDAIEASRLVLNQFLSLSQEFSSTGVREPLSKKETPLVTYFHFSLFINTTIYDFIIPSARTNGRWLLHPVVDGFSFQPPIKEAIHSILGEHIQDQPFSSHFIFIVGKMFDSDLVDVIERELADLLNNDQRTQIFPSLVSEDLPTFCLITFKALQNILANMTAIPKNKRTEMLHLMLYELLRLKNQESPERILVMGQQFARVKSQEQSLLDILRRWQEK
ncbi:MAG: hypothetical protein ACFFC7_25925 [Candidatus Hermodarchaeota archaeon]